MNIFQKSKFLLLTVFITGACVLVVEVLAIRMLSPYFGNTIFSVSSVLAVILFALSLGYFFGGILADKYPNHRAFYAIIFLSGIMIFFIQIINTIFVPYLGFVLPITYGPLVVSILLFLIPSLLLGMLSPFVIKLVSLSLPELGIGRVSGRVFFFSTLGSIAGSLLTGFYFIPNFGISQILIGVAIVLSALGIAPLLLNNKGSLFLGFLVLSLALSFSIKPTKAENIVYEVNGTYSRLSVVDGIYKGNATRFLFMDKNNSSAMLLDSSELAFPYSKYYKLYKLIIPEAKKFFVIGGGAYSVPADILSSTQDTEVGVSEIEPTLIDVAEKYFLLKNPIALQITLKMVGVFYMTPTKNTISFLATVLLRFIPSQLI